MLTDYFNEEERIKVKVKNSILSPYQYYQLNKDIILKLYNKKLYPNNKDRIYNMREYIYKNCKEATLFKITSGYSIIRYIIKDLKLNINKIDVLDPSSGWGDRLIIFLSLKVKSYTGYDPNINLQNGYNKIITTLGNKQQQKNYKINCLGFEYCKDINKYDIVFTSPPYFDYEEYTNDETQSYIKYNTFDKWKNDFFKNYIINCYNACKSGGVICIHISDNKDMHIVKYLHEIMNKLNCKKYINFGIIGNKNILPMWSWIKN
jgi:16S rRNA G966 N2-methylase RsmD